MEMRLTLLWFHIVGCGKQKKMFWANRPLGGPETGFEEITGHVLERDLWTDWQIFRPIGKLKMQPPIPHQQ
jgi:hypothetical protein